jgi:hypothetical protein
MTDEPDSLMLRFLRRIDSKIDGVIETLQELGHRLNRVESGLAAIKLKRRLDLNDA